MYTLCTLNDKELDTGHNSPSNSELSYSLGTTYNLRLIKYPVILGAVVVGW